MTSETRRGASVLLTGVTGFVGKVVLEELLRRSDELGLETVHVLIRPSKKRDGTVLSPEERFRKDVAKAALFSLLPKGWEKRVQVVAGELSEPKCGIAPKEREKLVAGLTHVVHCAASIEFDLPVAEAAAANITSALEVLELARSSPHLKAMVDVSTCYVTPWRPRPVEEELVPLPRPAAELYRDIREGRRSEEELKQETGHPNTYTYTKCIAEHLLTERRGNVPLTIVRPSVVSASWQRPFPGWIDSAAAFAGYVLYTGLGLMKAFVANPQTRLDVIPVDEVSRRIVDAAFVVPAPRAPEKVRIVQACSGLEHATRMDLSADVCVRYFGTRPGVVSKPGLFMGKHDHGFARMDFVKRQVPTTLLKAALTVANQGKALRKLEKVDDKVRYMNQAFRYFTHNTFDFRSSDPFRGEGFSPAKYCETVCAGLYAHYLEHDETELTLAGEGHEDARGDLSWALEKEHGNWAIRSLGFGLRKALRRCTSKVTFDRVAFERTMAEVPANAMIVLAPSHRSYFDFLLASYLCFQHPELGLKVPHIAAAEEFSKVPLVGGLLRQAQAFYLKRGVGQEDPELSRQLEKLASKGEPLMFFIEGQRSRSRRFLPPRRGLLRGLQATGRTCAIIPLSIAYDRVPEESAFERELTGGERSRMGLAPLAQWMARLAKGAIELGRVHIACGRPLVLEAETDVPSLSEQIVAEHQATTAATSFHLRAFLAEEPLENVDLRWLSGAITRRGGRVLESDLGGERGLPAVLRQSLRNQWMHWFYADALALCPHDLVVQDHVERHGWLAPEASRAEPADPRVKQVVDGLFEPVRLDYALVARLAGEPGTALRYPTPASLVREYPTAHLQFVEDAFRALAEREILSERRSAGAFTWGPRAHEIAAFRRALAQKTDTALPTAPAKADAAA